MSPQPSSLLTGEELDELEAMCLRANAEGNAVIWRYAEVVNPDQVLKLIQAARLTSTSGLDREASRGPGEHLCADRGPCPGLTAVAVYRGMIAAAPSLGGDRASQGCGDGQRATAACHTDGSASAAEAACPGAEWLLVYVDQWDADLIVGWSRGISRVIDGTFGEDNGLRTPKGLARGLYRVSPAYVWEDEDDIEITGDWHLVLGADAALAALPTPTSERNRTRRART